MLQYQAIMNMVVMHLLGCEVNPLAWHRVVVTTQGSVRGYFAPRPPHYSFLGLPYGRAPTRYDRYKAPEPPPRWSGIFEAVHRIKCPQPDGSGDENCLVVNVFTPKHAITAPVLVHIHGGGFHSGWGTFVAPAIFLEQGFVFISLNYRIGALGFLSLGLENVRGNAGIKDQVAALYWIYRNVKRFGGNPSDVTVYGTGSGAVSIELLLISGLTKNLFHKAILEAGSILSPSSISYNPEILAYNLARTLGYRGDSSPESLREYYYKVPVNILANISRIFQPCIEKSFATSHSLLDRDPKDILQDGKYQHVPMMIVYTHAQEVDVILKNKQKFELVVDNMEALLPNNVIIDNDDAKYKILNLIKKFYFEDIGSATDVIGCLIDYINDVYMAYPIAKSATYHTNRNKNSIYLMKFANHRRLNRNNNKILTYITSDTDNDEQNTGKKLAMLLTNFISLGDPTPLTSPLLPVVWQPVQIHEVDGKIVLQNIPYLQFDSTFTNRLLSGPHLKFWDNIYEKFHITLTKRV